MRRWRFWFEGVRPKTLIASFSPIVLASVWVVTQVGAQYFNSLIFSLILTSAISIQIATNFINDAIDFKKGADTAERLGPTRLVNSGLASYGQVLKVAIFFLFLAVLTGLPLVWMGGWPILMIGLVSLFLAYSYTAGPMPLAYLGLGEVFVILFFGVIPAIGTVYLLTATFDLGAAILGGLAGLKASSLILINNMRDMTLDQQAGRKTLPIRFGSQVSFVLLSAFLVLPDVSVSVWVIFKGAWVVGLLPLLTLPQVYRLLKDIQLEKLQPSQRFNSFLSRAGRIQLRWTIFVIATLIICSKFGFPLTH